MLSKALELINTISQYLIILHVYASHNLEWSTDVTKMKPFVQ